MRHETQKYESAVQELLRLDWKIGREGFEDLKEPEILELIQHQDKLTAQEIDEILINPQRDEKESLLIVAPTLSIICSYKSADFYSESYWWYDRQWSKYDEKV